MTLMGSIHRMPRVTPTRTWTSTETEQARIEIAAEIEKVLDANDKLNDVRKHRNEVFRKHYAAGVDPRDLLKIARENGWPSVALNTVHDMVRGARDND